MLHYPRGWPIWPLTRNRADRRLRPYRLHRRRWRRCGVGSIFSLDKEGPTSHLKDVSKRIRDNSLSFVINEVEQSHGICFACSCIAVDEDKSIIPLIFFVNI